MSLSIKEYAEISKSVFKSATVESSSDLIEVLYEIYKATFPDLVDNLSPIREMETDNWRVGFTNEIYIKNKLEKLDLFDLVDAEFAYMYVIDQFVQDQSISRIYKLDDDDLIGWSIFKELNVKRDYCKRLIAIARYK